MALQGGEYAVTGTATSIASALGITDSAKKHYAAVSLKAVGTADAYWGRSTVTATANRHGVLHTNTASPPTIIGVSPNRLINIDEWFLVGTAASGNNVYIGLIA